MAIIKTDSTYSLAETLSRVFFNGLNASNYVAGPAKRLDDKIAEAAQGQDQGSNPATGESWQTALLGKSASYTKLIDNYTFPSGLVRNGSEKYLFTGTGLDGGAQGQANRFIWELSSADTYEVPGLVQYDAKGERTVANIDFVPGSGTIVIGDFSLSGWEKESSSGYSYPGSQTGETSSYSNNYKVSFKGAANYEFGANGASLVSSTVYSFSTRSTSMWKNDGHWGDTASSGNELYQFAFASSGGLQYSVGAGGERLVAGTLSSLFYSDLENTIDDGTRRSEHEYFKWVNGASPDDDIDLQALVDLRMEYTSGNLEAALETLLKGNDVIYASDPEGSSLYGGQGNDKLFGGQGGDSLKGGEGDDLIKGGAGIDNLRGGAGNDTLKGDAGTDFLYGDEGDDLLDGGAGSDDLYGNDGNDRLYGGTGLDELFGGAGDDYLDGGAGHDDLSGGAGSDVLKGGAGQDRLRGDDGDDVLDGGAGNDLLIGGTGRDVMTGGSGIDGFQFARGDSGDGELSLGSLDQITGFNVAQDRLLLDFAFSGADVKLLQGAQSYEALLAAAEADGSFIVVGYDTGNTYVFVDMDKNGSLDTAIQLVGIKGEAAAAALVFEQG